MSGAYDDSGGASYITMSAGGTGAAGTGAFTIAVLWSQIDGSTFHINMALGGYASTTLTRGIFFDSSTALFGSPSDFSSGFGSVSRNTWYLSAISKPAGSANFVMHQWAYSSTGSGAMSHGAETGAGAHGDGSTITTWRIGSGDLNSNGLIAVVGVWNSQLSNAQLDTLVSIHLSAWSALSPQALISLQNWNGSTGCTDVVGTSSQSSITGTVGTGANPPSFDFSLTANVPAPRPAPRLTVPVMRASNW